MEKRWERSSCQPLSADIARHHPPALLDAAQLLGVLHSSDMDGADNNIIYVPVGIMQVLGIIEQRTLSRQLHN
jgi:hypothetical protein